MIYSRQIEIRHSVDGDFGVAALCFVGGVP
jgi:hypothetical protein